MSVAEPKRNQPKQKQKDPKPQAAPNENELLKTVVHCLPPSLPEEIFWRSVQPWVNDDSIIWKAFCAGKLRKRQDQDYVPSRAYIAFKYEESRARFRREYGGHRFRNKAGHEIRAIVEFGASFRIPSKKRKPDARNAMIDKAIPMIVASQKHSEAAPAPLSHEAKKIAAAQKATSPTQTARVTHAAKSISAESANLPAKPPSHVSTIRTIPRSLRSTQASKVPATASLPPKPVALPAPFVITEPAPFVPSASDRQGRPVVRLGGHFDAASNTAVGSSGGKKREKEPLPGLANVALQKDLPSKSKGVYPPSLGVPSASDRQGRPVVGLGEHFDAASNAAVGSSGGKKREKEPLPGLANVALQEDVPSKLKDVYPPRVGVPNSLQRGEGYAPGVPMSKRRPQPTHIAEGPAVEPLIVGTGGSHRGRRGTDRGAPAPPRGG